MTHFVLFAFFGAIAQLVDGTLGMAFGVTSTTLLLIAGTSPATASASVHLAEIGTSLVSGFSHWKFRNVDWKIVFRLAVPGGVGAFIGATVLSNLSTEVAEPWMAGVLLTLGAYIFIRFTLRPPRTDKAQWSTPRRRHLGPLGLFAGFVDATGGGGWGPVATPALLGSGRVEPRKVIGSVDTSEFVVSVAASAGFLLALGDEQLNWVTVAGLLFGGALAAPLAAWLVSRVPTRLLGSLVGGIVILTNSRTLLTSYEVAGPTRAVVYVVLSAIWAAAVAYSVRGLRLDRARAENATPEHAGTGPA
ncbi:sulfite exporter TauE/SafE family protein [Streptomyces sp. N2-109]|uniref:Probable membrane transporter protein n=1 Tax=Streptomyces gossypii TaxID=2883101 RepID=A0ABT2JN88_9ACTN|nr:sulfite exporter TauE/SafE family protein [Streptomyces gossypii]MCT2589347.1 sulfite exporter TauE/SafE family protein [Streptomyces gossypii]